LSEVTVSALVLKRRESGETDRRLTLLTVEQGKIDVVAKGAKKSASRLAGVSDPLSVATMTLAKGKVNQFVTQAQPSRSFPGLRRDYDRLSLAFAWVELLAAILPWGEPDENAFELAISALKQIEDHPKPIVALIWAEQKLLELSGHQPSFESCVVTGGAVKEAEAWVSASAGGYVSRGHENAFADRLLVRAEVLYGLSRIGMLDTPPPNLKFADECIPVLMEFWKHILDIPLPANEAVKQQLRHAHLNGDN
jgi:DNA repair protein RecO (recombination protein O)